MQWVSNICREQSKPIYSHIRTKLDHLLKMMPKINYFEDRIEQLEHALTAYDRKMSMESKINDLSGTKLKKRFLNKN